MTEARIIAVLGALFAALLATWFGNEIYLLVESRPAHFYDPYAIWKAWGIPAAIAAAVATHHLTRNDRWLPRRWQFWQLLLFASRCAGMACLLCVPIQLAWVLLATMMGMMESSSGGFGVMGAAFILVFIDVVAIAFGILPAIALQMLVLLLARAIASGVGLETQSMDEEQVES